MKQIYIITILLAISVATAMAQEEQVKERAHKSHFYINAAIDYLPTSKYTNNVQGNTNLSTTASIGGSIGAAYLLQHKSHLFMLTGIDFRIAPKKVTLRYSASSTGFVGSTLTEEETFSYNKAFITPYIKLGYSFLLPNTTNSIDLALGFNFNVPLNGGNNNNQEVIYRNINNNTELVRFQNYEWGNRTTTVLEAIPFNMQYSAQLSYRMNKGLIKGKGMRIGVDFNRQILHLDNNNIEVYYYDGNRNEIGNSTYKDIYTALSLFVSFGL